MQHPYAMRASPLLIPVEHYLLGLVRFLEAHRLDLGSAIPQLVSPSLRTQELSTQMPLFARFHVHFQVPGTAHISMPLPCLRGPFPYLLPRRIVVPLRFNPRFASRLCCRLLSIFSLGHRCRSSSFSAFASRLPFAVLSRMPQLRVPLCAHDLGGLSRFSSLTSRLSEHRAQSIMRP